MSTAAREGVCPICRKPAAPPGASCYPFCSDRCRLIDLGHWAAEEYKVSEPAPFLPPENHTE